MMKPKNILFRADSSSTIGTGHIMRDIVLAEQFEDANIIFATQDLPGNINYKVEEKGYVIEILNSNDIEEVNELIKKYNIDMIVIDHYSIDEKYEKQLKIKNCPTEMPLGATLKIMVLDDTYEKHHCDILLNHNIYAQKDKYKELVPKNCELLCGSEYTLLRDEFLEAKKNEREKISNIKNIFIAMGGSDQSNINIKILKALKNFPNIHANIVTTTANQYLNELKAYIKDKANITLYINSNKIATIMNQADFAIVTPSVTLNEVFYMDIPFIAIKTAENQIYMSEYLLSRNYKILLEFNHIKLQQEIKETLKTLDLG